LFPSNPLFLYHFPSVHSPFFSFPSLLRMQLQLNGGQNCLYFRLKSTEVKILNGVLTFLDFVGNFRVVYLFIPMSSKRLFERGFEDKWTNLKFRLMLFNKSLSVMKRKSLWFLIKHALSDFQRCRDSQGVSIKCFLEYISLQVFKIHRGAIRVACSQGKRNPIILKYAR